MPQQQNRQIYYKFPRIYHFEFSENLQNDDRRLPSTEGFVGKNVIVSLKCDGECANLTSDRVYARSVDSGDHISRHWMKQLHARIKHHFPKNCCWRVTGENLFALHSIYYTELESYFYVFNIFDEDNYCLDWDTTKEFANYLGLKTVPVLYDGPWDEEKIKNLEIKTDAFKGWIPKENIKDFVEFRKLIISGKNIEEFANEAQEGYVCRITDCFHYNDYSKYTAKRVQKNHVKSSDNWMWETIIPNKMRKSL
jgi:hypothetical protein